MASANLSPLKDIDEKFLQCHICLNRLKDPKIFPCLHHYCRGCLDKVLKKVLSEPTEGDGERSIECPVCREKHQIPDNGVDGLKTDFNTKNIIEFIELYDSVKHEPLRVCIHCNQKHKAISYCFKCNDFLCEKCHEHHLTNPVVKDHRPHVFSLIKAEAQYLTVEKLASLKEAPRCSKHPTKLSELCCCTCGNMPICMPCTYGEHQGHALKEVSVLAETERQKLIGKLRNVMEYKHKVYEDQAMLNSANGILSRAAKAETAKLQEEHDNVEKQIKMKQLSNRGIIRKERQKVQVMLKEKLNKRKLERDEKMKIEQDKYERACKEYQRHADILLAGIQEREEAENDELQEEMESLSGKFKGLLTSLQDEQQEQATSIKQLTVNFNDIVRRFENVTKMASGVLAAKDDWTDVQCIPDINAAIDPLMEEVREDISPELKTLTVVEVKSILSCSKRRVCITGKEESVVIIRSGDEWNVTDMAGSEMGNVVVTGGIENNNKSFISVNDMMGVQLRKDEFPSNHVIRHRRDALSDFGIVTAWYPSEIGVYDEQNGSYNRTDVGHIVKKDYNSWCIYCVAVDPSNHNIIVGCTHKRDVHVFDRNVNYVNTLMLPYSRPRGPNDIAVQGTNLLVCESSSGGAYATTMNGSICEQLYEFSKPSVNGRTCSDALRVCTDENSHIYMLWSHQSQPGKVIAQYAPDGRQLLTTRSVDNAAACITTVITDKTEKLLVATRKTGVLYVYGLSCDILS